MNLSRLFPNDRGYSLTEIMVVVALIVVMSGVGYSGFSSWQKRERLNSVAYQFADCLKEARTLAIEKRLSHTFTFDSSQKQYILFVDKNGNCSQDDGESTIYRVNVAALDPDISITTNLSSAVLRYDHRGMPRNIFEGFGAGTVTFLRPDSASLCTVTISALGSVTVDTSENQ